MSELERILDLVELLELTMVENDVISDEGVYSDHFADIKSLLYNEISDK